MNESMNGEGVCRTTPATPGLLITWLYHVAPVQIKKKDAFGLNMGLTQSSCDLNVVVIYVCFFSAKS